LLFAPYRLQASGPLLLDLLELRLDDVVLAVLGLAVGGAVALGRRTATRLLRRLGVHRLGELVRGPLERVGGGPHRARIVRLEGLLRLAERTLDLAPHARVERRAVIPERLLGLIDVPVELVAGVGELALLLVVLGVGRGLPDHAVDLVLVEAA